MVPKSVCPPALLLSHNVRCCLSPILHLTMCTRTPPLYKPCSYSQDPTLGLPSQANLASLKDPTVRVPLAAGANMVLLLVRLRVQCYSFDFAIRCPSSFPIEALALLLLMVLSLDHIHSPRPYTPRIGIHVGSTCTALAPPKHEFSPCSFDPAIPQSPSPAALVCFL